MSPILVTRVACDVRAPTRAMTASRSAPGRALACHGRRPCLAAVCMALCRRCFAFGEIKSDKQVNAGHWAIHSTMAEPHGSLFCLEVGVTSKIFFQQTLQVPLMEVSFIIIIIYYYLSFFISKTICVDIGTFCVRRSSAPAGDHSWGEGTSQPAAFFFQLPA